MSPLSTDSAANDGIDAMNRATVMRASDEFKERGRRMWPSNSETLALSKGESRTKLAGQHAATRWYDSLDW